MATDWSTELWPSSFKGVPFWTRKSGAEFGKRLQKDEFPELDTPFVQELGASLRPDQIEAYLVGDTSNADADAFVGTLLSLGTGTLVLPDEGPVQVMFEKGRRAYEFDRMGLIGFSLTFVRVGGGSASAGPSADYLANMVSVAADAVEGALSALTGQIDLF